MSESQVGQAGGPSIGFTVQRPPVRLASLLPAETVPPSPSRSGSPIEPKGERDPGGPSEVMGEPGIDDLLAWSLADDGLFDPADPADAEELAADLAAGGALTDELLRVLGWDEPPEGFDPVDVLVPIGDLTEDGLLEEVQAAFRGIASTQGR